MVFEEVRTLQAARASPQRRPYHEKVSSEIKRDERNPKRTLKVISTRQKIRNETECKTLDD